uniref:Insulin-like peptide 05 n=1 Tax=Exaiptasia diaphana TaxID=2652724 RepID=INS5_EXADI
MKTPILFVVVVAVLIVTDSAEGFKGKANSFLKPLQRRGLEEECCQETCSYHEIWENCKKLCSDELHKMFVEICQPPTEKVPERD